jgi:hypothetical protein
MLMVVSILALVLLTRSALVASTAH